MPIITKIEFQKKNDNRVNIFLDGEFAFGLNADLVYEYKLERGKEIENDFIEDVLKAEEKKKAENYSLILLSSRVRTEKEIIQKMKLKGYEEDTIQGVIKKLTELGYINDEVFAEMYTEDKQKLGKLGGNRIKQELMQKGVSREIAQKVVEERTDKDEEYETALEIGTRKYEQTYHKDEKRKAYQKLSAFLVRKGYSFDIVSRVVKEILR